MRPGKQLAGRPECLPHRRRAIGGGAHGQGPTSRPILPTDSFKDPIFGRFIPRWADSFPPTVFVLGRYAPDRNERMQIRPVSCIESNPSADGRAVAQGVARPRKKMRSVEAGMVKVKRRMFGRPAGGRHGGILRDPGSGSEVGAALENERARAAKLNLDNDLALGRVDGGVAHEKGAAQLKGHRAGCVAEPIQIKIFSTDIEAIDLAVEDDVAELTARRGQGVDRDPHTPKGRAVKRREGGGVGHGVVDSEADLPAILAETEGHPGHALPLDGNRRIAQAQFRGPRSPPCPPTKR